MATKTAVKTAVQRSPNSPKRRLNQRLERSYADAVAIGICLREVADSTPEPFRGAVVQTLADALYLQGRLKRLLDHAARSGVV